MAPVLQIMPKLWGLGESLDFHLSVEHMKVDSTAILSSPEESDVASMLIPPPLAHNPSALFAKELCDMLRSLEVAIPRCRRAISWWVIVLVPASERKSPSVAKTRRMAQYERSLWLLVGCSSVSWLSSVWAVL
jgi:hypothetical protein